MKAPRLPAVALLVALLLAGAVAALAPSMGAAQPAGPGPQRERPLPGRHIEGRIAFLRAELKITDGQQALWERVAAAMRDGARQMDQVAQQNRAARDKPQSAADRADQRARFTEASAASAKAFAAAFRPLYDSLTDDQKKTADELFDRSFRGRGPRR